MTDAAFFPPRESSPPSPSSGKWRVALYLALFFMGFALTAGVVHWWGLERPPLPSLGILEDKLKLIHRQRDQINVIFLGTSRTDMGIHPESFDQAMAEQGCPGVYSFNFGIEHLNPIEAQWALNRIAEIAPPRLRWIVAELPVSRYYTMFNNRFSMRYRVMLGWENLLPYLEDIRRQPILRRYQLRDAGWLLATMVVDRSGIGLLSRSFFPLTSLKDPFQAPDDSLLKGSGRGFYFDYMAGNLPKPDRAARSAERWIARQKVYIDSWKDEYAARNGKGHFARVRPLLEKIIEYRYQPLLISLPAINAYALSQPLIAEVNRWRPELPTFDFNHPDHWPEFFRAEHLFGGAHLNEKGAALFSRTLAVSLCPVMARDTPPPPPPPPT
ncbi:MAG: hypothetical protein HQL51_09595, partial [Magnetococcales bacterium]|nr:hypothetical protein [Magnetococcales bacterium]